MKGYLLNKPGEIIYTDIDYPTCERGWCIVKVKDVGICSSDIPRIFSKGMYHMPAIPGHEFSGVVVDASDDDKSYIGKRVGVFPLIPCMKCSQCQKGLYEMCRSYDYIGSRRNGAFAEYVAVPTKNLIELEPSISYRSAAMLEPLSVAMHAINKVDEYSDKKVAVIGTGLIGFAIAEFAKLRQAKVVNIIGRSNSKKAMSNQVDGVEFVLLDQIKDSYDIIFEAVGTNDSINKAIEISEPGASIVFVGNPAGDIHFSQDTYWKILRSQLKLYGTWNSKFNETYENDWYEVKNMILEKKFNPEVFITHIFNQDSFLTALDIMKNKKEPYCKIMIEWGDEAK